MNSPKTNLFSENDHTINNRYFQFLGGPQTATLSITFRPKCSTPNRGLTPLEKTRFLLRQDEERRIGGDWNTNPFRITATFFETHCLELLLVSFCSSSSSGRASLTSLSSGNSAPSPLMSDQQGISYPPFKVMGLEGKTRATHRYEACIRSYQIA